MTHPPTPTVGSRPARGAPVRNRLSWGFAVLLLVAALAVTVVVRALPAHSFSPTGSSAGHLRMLEAAAAEKG